MEFDKKDIKDIIVFLSITVGLFLSSGVFFLIYREFSLSSKGLSEKNISNKEGERESVSFDENYELSETIEEFTIRDMEEGIVEEEIEEEKKRDSEKEEEDDSEECPFSAAWQSTLGEYAHYRDFNVGAYLNVCFSDEKKQLNPEDCKETLLKEYPNMILSVQDQWKWSESKRGEINAPKFDEMLNFARHNRFKLHFFHLIYSDRYSPSWLFPDPGNPDCNGWSKEELLSIMEDRIKNYIQYTKDVVVAWNVVNEVFEEDGSFAEFCWYRVIGEEYVDKAFLYAREATPDGLLVFNDNFGNGRMNRAEIDSVFGYIKAAKARGIPIDAFGLQNHLYSSSGEQFSEGYIEDLEYLFRKANNAGVRVLITEMDVYQASYSDYDVRDLYRKVVARCLRNNNCISFSTWGVDDKSSWLIHTHNLLDARPLLFDSEFKRKPAYYGVMTAIKDNRLEVCVK